MERFRQLHKQWMKFAKKYALAILVFVCLLFVFSLCMMMFDL